MIFNGLFNFFIDFKFDDIICNDKIKNNNLGKNYLSNNIKNNAKINNYYNNIYGTGNNTYNNKDILKNNSKPNENQKFNLAKQRRPSPIIKSNNYLNKKINK